MAAIRKTITLSVKAIEVLQHLAEDCELDASQCINQLILRHSCDIRKLFSLDPIIRTQSYADDSIPESIVRNRTQSYADESETVQESAVPLTNESVDTPLPESEPPQMNAFDRLATFDWD